MMHALTWLKNINPNIFVYIYFVINLLLYYLLIYYHNILLYIFCY